MKHLSILFILLMLLIFINTNVFAIDSSKIYFDFIASGSEELKISIPGANQFLKGDIDTEGFIIGGEFISNNFLFGGEYASISYDGGGDASCLDIISGFGFSEKAFFTIEYLSASSDSEIDYSGMLFGVKGFSDMSQQFFIEGYFALNLLIDGSTTLFGKRLSGDTDIMKYGLKLGFKATENIVATLGYKVQDMSYEDFSGTLDITDSVMTIGITATF